MKGIPLRFTKLVFIGDTIRTRVTITEKRDHKRPEYCIVVEESEVLNQRDECVMACENILLVLRRQSGNDFDWCRSTLKPSESSIRKFRF